MSGNGISDREKELEKLARINKVATEYISAKSDAKKEVLLTKLWQKCLAHLLHVDGSAEGDELDKVLYDKLEKNEANIAKRYNLKKTLNTEVFAETFRYALNKYCQEQKDDFTKIFLSTYSIRQKASIGVDYFNDNMHGFSTSDYERKNWQAFNKFIEIVAETDERFADKQLHMLSEQDIHYILNKAGVGFKDEKGYVELAKRYALVQRTLELDKAYDEDGTTFGENCLRDKVNIDKDVSNRLYIIDIMKEVVERASRIQKKYFICFITLDIFNHYPNAISEDMMAVLDLDFLAFIKNRFNNDNTKWDKVPDTYMSEYLHVQKPAVTKQRQNYSMLIKDIGESMGRGGV